MSCDRDFFANSAFALAAQELRLRLSRIPDLQERLRPPFLGGKYFGRVLPEKQILLGLFVAFLPVWHQHCHMNSAVQVVERCFNQVTKASISFTYRISLAVRSSSIAPRLYALTNGVKNSFNESISVQEVIWVGTP